MNPLVAFQQDEHIREAFKAFMVSQLEEMAIEKVFDKKSIDGIYEARELVDKTFNKLAELYEPKKKANVESSR